MKDNNILNRILADMKIEIDIPVSVWERYGSPEYWKKLERELNHEIDDFNEFVRDHRSRDSYQISIRKDYVNICKFCGHEYPDDYDGIVDCCDEAIELQKEYIKRLLAEEY